MAMSIDELKRLINLSENKKRLNVGESIAGGITAAFQSLAGQKPYTPQEFYESIHGKDTLSDFIIKEKIKNALEMDKQKQALIDAGIIQDPSIQDKNIGTPIDLSSPIIQNQGGSEVIPQQIPKPKVKGFKLGGINYEVPETPEEREQKLLFEEEKKRRGVRATETEKLNIKRKELNKTLEEFFLVDDMIDRAEGGFLPTTIAGLKTTARQYGQKGPKGFAARAHNALVKRLRVQLVRAAGDVGNLNIVEQQAAELLIPVKWDAKGTADLKRAFLRSVTEAINDGQESKVKMLINKWMETKEYQEEIDKENDVSKMSDEEIAERLKQLS